MSKVSKEDLFLFNQGSLFKGYKSLGCHLLGSFNKEQKKIGANFTVWAPNAEYVSVIGDFNGWNSAASSLQRLESSGLWSGHIAEAHEGDCYKYFIKSNTGEVLEKADPYAFFSEVRPRTASKIYSLDGYDWQDKQWIESKNTKDIYSSPVSIYELHLGSWRYFEHDQNPEFRGVTYHRLAETLPQYLNDLGFTHVEFLPVSEHPYDGSWGYQTTGYFSVNSRFGTPKEFMYLVDKLHQAGIGVILDWVPAHFATDEHSLARFDGTYLYEHEDPRQGYHPDWGTYIFNFGRKEVSSYLISNAMFWLEMFHIDGLRIDAVASMLYLDYSRKADSWIPNKYGGRENLEAMTFLQSLNAEVYREFPNTLMIAEESTAWPKVTKPTSEEGLGFGFKWNMGWMNDTLRYFEKDPIYRSFEHSTITFSMVYSHNENFILPLSHDEVVHEKKSLINKMPGDEWQKFAHLRLLLSYMYAHPGKKLLFMGSELAMWEEWSHERDLPWGLLQYPNHSGVSSLVKDLNKILVSSPALHELDFSHEGFQWLSVDDYSNSSISFLRFDKERKSPIIAVFNFTPIVREEYRIGVPTAGEWEEIFNSDSNIYGGSNLGNLGKVISDPIPCHGFPNSICIKLAPLGAFLLTKTSNDA